jgi:signal transduction histidine kinase/CheY-like chemotaxis protein
MNLEECYYSLGILDSSLSHGEQALAVMEEIDLNHQGFVYSMNGYVLYHMGKKEEGFKNMKFGLRLGEKEKGIERISTTQLNHLADCYLKESQTDSAIVYAMQAYTLASVIPVLLEQERGAKILASAYEKQGEVDSAFHYLKELIRLKNEVENSAEIIHARELKAQSKAKEEELKHLLELTKKDETRNMLIISALLFFIVATGLYSRIRYVRKVNHKLEAAKTRAERSEAFKQQFLANMSHEIRTPMNAILGMTNLTLDTDLSDQQREYLSAVKKSTENLLVIINDILDLSKLEAGKMDLELIPFNLSDQLQVVQNTLRFKAEEKGLEFIFRIDESMPKFLKGDPYRLNQVLINLCGNAIKFTDKGSVKVQVSILPTNAMVKFSVIDTGMGIPKEKAEKLFKAFQQADEGVSRKYGGTGLGLSISKTLVELQHGEIGLISEEGKGSEFYFTLPLNLADEKDIEALAKEKKLDVSNLSGIKILLVEDNRFNQIVLHDTILHLIEGSNVEIAENGEIAVEKVIANDYDIVLMDVNMPVMNGHEATKHIRENLDITKKNITILALTASILSDDIKEFEHSGMNGYIPKPFTREELLQTLNKHYSNT